MKSRPVIVTQQVCQSYLPQETTALMQATLQLSPYEMLETNQHIRINCYSLTGKGWRCAFLIKKATTSQSNAALVAIEYLSTLTLHHALSTLGHLESFALRRLKYGL